MGEQVVLLATAVLGGHAVAVYAVRRRGRAWPWWRSGSFVAGVVAVVAGLIDPVAGWAHHDLTGHVASHLLVGMLGPLLLVMSAPVTLLLKALPQRPARRLVGALRSAPVAVVANPVVAAVLSVGGLWAVYRTDLYAAAHTSPALNAVIHIHMLVAGYLFTAAMIGTDPDPARPGYAFRAVVLIVALGAHAVLAKSVYAYPPSGVATAQAEMAGQLMWYGGDAIHLLLIVAFCRQWLSPRRMVGSPARTVVVGPTGV